MNLNDEIVNKTLAEFMGRTVRSIDFANNIMYFENLPMRAIWQDKLYTKDLNALVPVWEKLAIQIGEGVWINFTRHGIKDYHLSFFRHSGKEYDSTVSSEGSPQQAAAYATCKAIMELEK